MTSDTARVQRVLADLQTRINTPQFMEHPDAALIFRSVHTLAEVVLGLLPKDRDVLTDEAVLGLREHSLPFVSPKREPRVCPVDDSTSTGLDLYALSPTDILNTDQVASLRMFGTKTTLEQNRSLGRPGLKWLKITGRVYYRVSDLLAFLEGEQVKSAEAFDAQRARFDRQQARRGRA